MIENIRWLCPRGAINRLLTLHPVQVNAPVPLSIRVSPLMNNVHGIALRCANTPANIRENFPSRKFKMNRRWWAVKLSSKLCLSLYTRKNTLINSSCHTKSSCFKKKHGFKHTAVVFDISVKNNFFMNISATLSVLYACCEHFCPKYSLSLADTCQSYDISDNRPISIYLTTCLATRVRGIKQHKLHWGSEMSNSFLLLYSPKPRSRASIFLKHI